mmetsp:Transcript_56372/g.127400  ORF Transcript_56372/g.127400 Transcript_56372/m.127400 type:complete len:232 (+) Transcript_56372:54-749(+)
MCEAYCRRRHLKHRLPPSSAPFPPLPRASSLALARSDPGAEGAHCGKRYFTAGILTSTSSSRSVADTSSVKYVLFEESTCFAALCHNFVTVSPRRFLCPAAYELYKHKLPEETMVISTPTSPWRWSKSSFSVASRPRSTSTLSQLVKPSGFARTGPMMIGSWSVLFIFMGGKGSDMTQSGNAKLTKEFLKSASFRDLRVTSFKSSALTRPVTIAVVVAIAGMILPAIILTL